MLKSIQEKLGPGLLFAASAVGVSHLIQSTRGGAAFGSSMLLIIVFVCLLKYPLFLFGAHYTAVTGNTIIDGYKKLGRWVLIIIFMVYVFELPFAIAGISVVSAGILAKSLNLELNEIVGALLLVNICLVFSAVGRYQMLEKISRVFVVLFMFCIIIGTFVSVANNINDYTLAFKPITLDTDSLFFMVAIAGWMPTGVGGALGISLWIHAKNQRLKRNLNLKEVRFDFNCSYTIVVLIGCCFSLMGAYTLLDSLNDTNVSGVNFVQHLFSVLTRSFSPWVHVLIIIGANMVMLSSLPVVVDLLPRLGTTLLLNLYPERLSERNRSQIFLAFIFYELISVSLVLALLFRSFTAFIDLVTSLGFLAAPIIAWLNHKVIFSGELTPGQQPSSTLRYWNIAAIIILSLVSLAYLLLKFTA